MAPSTIVLVLTGIEELLICGVQQVQHPLVAGVRAILAFSGGVHIVVKGQTSCVSISGELQYKSTYKRE